MKHLVKLRLANLCLLLAIAFGLSACLGGNDSNEATKTDKETSKSSEPVWKVPTGADPDYPDPEGKMDKSDDSLKKVEAKLIWKVPTGVDPIYATKVSAEGHMNDQPAATAMEPVWVVPTGADPTY